MWSNFEVASSSKIGSRGNSYFERKQNSSVVKAIDFDLSRDRWFKSHRMYLVGISSFLQIFLLTAKTALVSVSCHKTGPLYMQCMPFGLNRNNFSLIFCMKFIAVHKYVLIENCFSIMCVFSCCFVNSID